MYFTSTATGDSFLTVMPLFDLRKLFDPRKWFAYHPPSVSELQQHSFAVRVRYSQRLQSQINRWRSSPGGGPDTPLACLHRIYEFLVVDWTTAFRNEIEYFSHRCTWAVGSIPDPRDPDPLRYAILAVLTRLLCQAFN